MSARFAGAQRFLHQARAMVAVMIHGLQTAFLIVFPALAIVAALSDATSMTIPNWISAALAVPLLISTVTGTPRTMSPLGRAL